jgi:hypothetical protein
MIKVMKKVNATNILIWREYSPLRARVVRVLRTQVVRCARVPLLLERMRASARI